MGKCLVQVLTGLLINQNSSEQSLWCKRRLAFPTLPQGRKSPVKGFFFSADVNVVDPET